MARREEFESYFREYYVPLCCYAFSFVKNRDVCRDLVNDVFESVWNRLPEIDSRGIRAYLYTNLRNKCIDHLRREGHNRIYLEYLSAILSETTQTTIEEEDNEILRMKQIIEKLPSKTRYVVKECFLNEKKYKEVAEEQGISVSAVAKHIIKALKVLRAELTKKI